MASANSILTTQIAAREYNIIVRPRYFPNSVRTEIDLNIHFGTAPEIYLFYYYSHRWASPRLVRLETDNFHMLLRQQTDKLLFVWWANGKRIKEKHLGSHFPFSVWNGIIYIFIYIYIYTCICICTWMFSVYIYMENRNGKRRFLFLGL
jgi:hypothetical protein